MSPSPAREGDSEIEVGPIDPGAAAAQQLMGELDADIIARYPGQPPNGIDAAEFRAAGGYFILLRLRGEGTPVGCGAFRPVAADTVEIKRMFVRAGYRRRGYSKLTLAHLEAVARSRGFRRLILETGIRQPEAIGLYQAVGFRPIPKYGQYVASPNSLCFAKPA
jgi:GNAT superfamily N-acetyltransferase